uniref:Dynein regulatory complex subunit 3 n=1 Tax=Callorhinchus milii TaxID=7868 RepID=A0A4W3IEN8_CALMI
MSQWYNSLVPNIIDENMLNLAVVEQGPTGKAGEIAKEEGIDFKDVKHLQLDFRNILKIDNLWQFKTLTKLQMDNNIIEKIEGLETLINLVWLDLSFNNIEIIEGLDGLINLEDLTLYNNRISHIENMDSLANLQIFSIGNNHLNQLENILYLRRFQHLRTLNLDGNSLCEDERYKIYIAAYLPNLVYLDFRLIDKNITLPHTAEDLYVLELWSTLLHSLHLAAYVEYLNGSNLFDSMFAEDVEAEKLGHLPGLAEFAEFTEICIKIFHYGLRGYETREKEVKQFLECLQEAIEDNQNIGVEIIKDFEEKSKEFISEQQHIVEASLLEIHVDNFRIALKKLWNTLMNLEMQLVDQLEESDTTQLATKRMAVHLSYQFLNQITIAQCRDLENHYHENVLEIAVSTYEKMVKNEVEEEMPDELRTLFVDKDTIVNAVNASHDMHLLKIDNREDELVTRSNGWTTAMMDKLHMEEINRNRKRVLEINHYIDHWYSELEFLYMQEAV